MAHSYCCGNMRKENDHCGAVKHWPLFKYHPVRQPVSVHKINSLNNLVAGYKISGARLRYQRHLSVWTHDPF